MKQKLKLPYMLKNMSKIALLLTAMLFYARSSYAIPPSITGSYNVFGIDNCPTTCTIQNGGILTITGSSASSTFSPAAARKNSQLVHAPSRGPTNSKQKQSPKNCTKE